MTLERLSTGGTQGPVGFHEYMKLDKQFGGGDPRDLIRLGGVMGGSRLPHVLRAAGSAIREGVLFLPARTEESLDRIENGRREGDLARLDEAQAHLRASTELCWRELETGQRRPDLQIPPIESWLDMAFHDTYKDLICGEVTGQTIDELKERVHVIARYVSKLGEGNRDISLGRIGAKLLLMLGGLYTAGEPSLLLPAPMRGARRYKARTSEGSAEARAARHRAYDVVVLRPNTLTGHYQPVVPVQITRVKRVYDNPSDIIIVGLETPPLRVGPREVVSALQEAVHPTRGTSTRESWWSVVVSRMAEYEKVRDAFPPILTPQYNHHLASFPGAPIVN